MVSHKKERSGEDLKREITALIRELKDPRVRERFITVSKINMAQDLSYCRVYISSISGIDEAKIAVKGLESAQGFIRRELGKRLHFKKAPELSFVADDSIEQGMKIIEDINNIEKREKERDE